MSQRAVEGILGRLITDAEFRDEFFRDPNTTCEFKVHEAPTPQELDVLARINRRLLSEMAAILDPKIVRAVGVELQRLIHAA